MGVQNGYNGTKLFLFNGGETIAKEEFMDVEFYRLRYVIHMMLYIVLILMLRCVIRFNKFIVLILMYLTNCMLYVNLFVCFCRLFADKSQEKSENTASRISTHSKHSTRDEFVNKLQVKTIVDLLDVDQVRYSIT